MNRTKTIYFLSAIVCIIGCYALSLSYSLFVDTQEKEIVNATVPGLSYSLETSTFDIEAGSGELIKLKVINSGTADLKYGIKAVADTLNGATIQLVEKEDNDIVGELSASTTEGETSSKEVWVYVTNSTETDITGLTFNLTAKYSTLNFDADTFKTNSNIDCINTVKLLNNAILARAKSTEITDEDKTVYNDTFDLNNITNISGETDRMLALAEDDYGTSYVFRGNIEDNYIEFAGFTWRIVRINGDGSIRLILDGSLDKVSKDGIVVSANANLSAIDSGGLVPFKTAPYNDNTYIGYMYGGANKSDYNSTHSNSIDSTIKKYVDVFYSEYLYLYQENYIADSLFCADKTRGNGYITLGYGTNNTVYGAHDRLTNASTQPTLECANSENELDLDTLTEEQRTYSRFTSKIDERTTTSKGVLVNNDLTYPIGLLSADELVMAGAFLSTPNTTYYLHDAYMNSLLGAYWWTMTPNDFRGNKNPHVFMSAHAYASLTSDYVPTEVASVRPVINLKAETIIEGIGTKNEPYKIKK